MVLGTCLVVESEIVVVVLGSSEGLGPSLDLQV